MKKVFWCFGSFVTVAGMAGLVACGGSSSFGLGGTVTGLNQPGLVLVNGSNTIAIPANASSYSFPNKLSYGTSYDVIVQTDPVTKLPVQPRHLMCGVINGSGTAGTNVSTAVNVMCVAATHAVQGTINGLTATDATLTLAVTTGGITAQGSTVALASNATTFSFAAVPDGSTYSVSMTTSTGNKCNVDKGTGVMGETDVNLVITCVPG